MLPHQDLANRIDAASDSGDEKSLRNLSRDCERRLDTANSEERVFLLYYQSNTYAGIVSSKHNDEKYTWNWTQPDGIKNILLLRRAIREPAFDTLNPVFRCQIRTNLGNRLNSQGRVIAANEQWVMALDVIPNFAKAIANKAYGFFHYAYNLYDDGHRIFLISAAHSQFDEALKPEAFWESGDRDFIAPDLVKRRNLTLSVLERNRFDKNFDLNQWPLGANERECDFRRWCLQERLFLNPLNDAYEDTIAATDVLHLPDHIYKFDEKPKFPAYYNLMKQEYIGARYRLFKALNDKYPEFVMRDVLMLDSGEGQALGYFTDDLRASFRSTYSIFDKVGLFLNDYFEIGLKPKDVTFRRVWSKQVKGGSFEIRPEFRDRLNLPLRGLYFLSKDLYDPAFNEVAEPDADNIAKLRQQIEHRFLSFKYSGEKEDTETHRFISVDEFADKSLALLKMAREALIYVSLAMHREEIARNQKHERNEENTIHFKPLPVDFF